MISITTEADRYGTKIHTRGFGKIPTFRTKAMVLPSRIIMDIFYTVPPFSTIIVPVESPTLEKVRIGYHSEIIRLVLDLKGPDIPAFTTSSDNDEVIIALLSSKPPVKHIKSSEHETVPAAIKPSVPNDMPQETKQNRRDNTDKQFDASVSTVAPIVEKEKTSANKQQYQAPEDSTDDALTRMEADDGQDDTGIFLSGLHAYHNQYSSEAIENFNHIITTYSTGRYAERAHFLLAKSYEQLYADSLSTHFVTIKRHYDDAIYTFPTSKYTPDALISIGNICNKIGNHTEALGYYNIVIDQNKDTTVAVRALLPKAKILLMSKEIEVALSILEYVIDTYPGLSVETEARIEMAKVLFEMNNFKKSLRLLTELEIKNPANLSRYPERYLYLGYNYSQMGNDPMSRKYLLRYYNACPDREDRPLVLTKVADSYRNEGRPADASKIYQLVLERHPETEGALISMTRIAEQLEAGEWVIEEEVMQSLKIGGKAIAASEDIYGDIYKALSEKDKGNPLAQLAVLTLAIHYQKVKTQKTPVMEVNNSPSIAIGGKYFNGPEDIYMNIIDTLSEKDKENPLVHLAMLKLAVFYQKEKKYEKSLNVLMDLTRKYPRTKLREKIIHTLNQTLDPIFEQHMKAENYVDVINIYYRAKDLFVLLESPELSLTVARAFKHLKLNDMALSVYKSADSLLEVEKKPPDLLFHLSMDLFEKGNLKAALSRLDLLIDLHPTDKYTSLAYGLKGRIFLKEKLYLPAVEVLSSALKYHQESCERTAILIDKATALMAIDQNDNALKVTRQAKKLIGDCRYHDSHVSREIGDLLFHLGYPQDAISVFAGALETEKEADNRIRLNLAIARSYEAMDKKEDSMTIYNQISGMEDPFWSVLAEEKVKEMLFNQQSGNTGGK